MSKFFHIPEEIQRETRSRPLNEDRWFTAHQPLLLQMLQTRYGRELLCVDKHLPTIQEISKRHVRFQAGERTYVSEFRIGAKYANVVRYRWREFLEYANYLGEREYVQQGRMAVALGVPLIAGGTTTSFYPDPHPENTSVDGDARRTGVDETWATIRAGAGTFADDSGATGLRTHLRSSATSNQFGRLHRTHVLFDTSAIAGGDISSAIYSCTNFALYNEQAGETSENSRLELVASTSISEVALEAADYQNTGSVSFGSGLRQDGITGGVTEQDIALNASGLAAISKTGVTKFAVRSRWDLDNTVVGMTWSSEGLQGQIQFTADETGTAKDPKLVVTYGTLFARSLSAPIGLSATLSRVVVYGRSAKLVLEQGTDVLLLETGDALRLENIAAWVRSLSTAMGLGASLSRAFGHVRSLTATMGLSASLSRLQGYLRSLTTQIGLSTSLSRTGVYARPLTTQIGLSTSLSRAGAYARSLTTQIGLSASLSRVHSHVRSLTVAIGLFAYKFYRGRFKREVKAAGSERDVAKAGSERDIEDY